MTFCLLQRYRWLGQKFITFGCMESSCEQFWLIILCTLARCVRKPLVNHFYWTFSCISPNMLLDDLHHCHFNCFAGRTTIKQGESLSSHQCAPLPNQPISLTSLPPNRPVIPPQGNCHSTSPCAAGGTFPLRCMKYFLRELTVFLL